MKYLKYALYGFAALLILIVIAITIAFIMFDPNSFKGKITETVKQSKNRTLIIEGEIKLSIFPNIGVKIGKTTLSEPNSNNLFAAFDSVNVSVALLPLLRKEIIIDEIQIAGLNATLIRNKNGSMNIDDLLSKTETQETSKTQPIKFDIAGIKLSNAELVWHDKQKNQKVHLKNFNLKTGQLANKAKGKIELDTLMDSSDIKASLMVHLDGNYRYDLEQSLFSLEKFNAKLEGSARDINALNAKIQGNIEVQSQQKSINASDFEATAKGKIADMDLNEIKLVAPKLQVNLNNNAILLNKVSLIAKGKKATDQFDIQAQAPQLDISQDKASGDAVTAQIKVAGSKRNLDAKLNLSGVEGAKGIMRITKALLELEGDLKSEQDKSTVKGTLTTPIMVNLNTKILELNKLVADLLVTNPSLPQKSAKLPLNGNINLDYGKQSLSLDLATKFDESTILAKVNMPKIVPPVYNFDINIDRLNWDKYFPPNPNNKTEKPFDFSGLKGITANGVLSIQTFIMSNVKASHVKLTLKVAEGVARIDSATSQLYQGSLNGAVSINANNNHLALKGKLNNVSVGPLLKDALNKDLLERGQGVVNLDISGSGNTVAAIKKTLNGNVAANLKDGAIKGIDLAKTFRNIKTRLGKQDAEQDAEQDANKQEKTDFSELSASFVIKNGIAHNEDLSVKSPFIRLGGSGDINIGENTLNYLAKASVVNTSGGQGGKELNELKGLTIPVRVTGNLDAPRFRIELGKLVSEQAKQKLEEKILPKEKKEEIKKDLRENLKKLFKK